AWRYSIAGNTYSLFYNVIRLEKPSKINLQEIYGSSLRFLARSGFIITICQAFSCKNSIVKLHRMNAVLITSSSR
ncbi:MAG: hypothetical protein ACRD5H_16690, partial [Nitrososphaerales archaeon]